MKLGSYKSIVRCGKADRKWQLDALAASQVDGSNANLAIDLDNPVVKFDAPRPTSQSRSANATWAFFLAIRNQYHTIVALPVAGSSTAYTSLTPGIEAHASAHA